MSYAKARDENEREIVATLHDIGASVYRLHVPCDLLVGFRGATFLLEVKRPKGGKLTELQEAFVQSWRGSDVHIVRNPSEALVAIGAISREQAAKNTNRIQ